MPNAHLSELLEASRIHWIERPMGPEWHEWLVRTAHNAYRGRAPEFSSLRIHSLPGCLWEVIESSNGEHCLIADDELTATLAELRLLSLPGATPDAGYDKSILMLADAFRASGDIHRYAVCMGWALPRTQNILRLRTAAFNKSGNSAETMLVLLHEVAHRVLGTGNNDSAVWRQICSDGVEKLLFSLSQGGQHRNLALSDSMRFGLDAMQAERQIATYLDHLRGNSQLLEELTCDLLAVMAFLNLNSLADVIGNPDIGPTGMTTKQVGDALLAAHGAIQNMQLLTSVQTIAASASLPAEERVRVPDRSCAELTARSSVLVFLISNLMQFWCIQGHLRSEWPTGVPNAKGALLHAIERRNTLRTTVLLAPLEDIDGIFHEPERYGPFELAGLRQLGEASIAWPGRRKPLDVARWSLTLASSPE